MPRIKLHMRDGTPFQIRPCIEPGTQFTRQYLREQIRKPPMPLFRAAVLVAMAGLALGACRVTPPPEGAPAHHTSDGFRNPEGSPRHGGTFLDMAEHVLRRIGDSFSGADGKTWDHVIDPVAARRGFDALNGTDGITWLGHVAFLLRLDGTTVLTDPFLSDRAGPLPPFGSSRWAGPGMAVGDLPSIDVLLVSHNHYDHLSEETVEALTGKDRIEVVVPLGLASFFRERGYSRVHEMDWGDTLQVNGLTITALPVIHFSGRGLFDRDESLWAGYAIRSAGHRFFFSGDTGYGSVFRNVVAAHGPFDFGLMPIGAYEPRALMQAVHVTPEEAVAVARDVGARTIVAHHWGTIPMAEEPFLEPPERFRAAGRRAGYAESDLWLLKIGETRALPPPSMR